MKRTALNILVIGLSIGVLLSLSGFSMGEEKYESYRKNITEYENMTPRERLHEDRQRMRNDTSLGVQPDYNDTKFKLAHEMSLRIANYTDPIDSVIRSPVEIGYHHPILTIFNTVLMSYVWLYYAVTAVPSFIGRGFQ